MSIHILVVKLYGNYHFLQLSLPRNCVLSTFSEYTQSRIDAYREVEEIAIGYERRSLF